MEHAILVSLIAAILGSAFMTGCTYILLRICKPELFKRRNRMAQGKEKIYDEYIAPLMAEIIEICRRHKIAMIADFGLEGQTDEDSDLHCVTALLSDDFGPSDSQLEAWATLKPKATHGFVSVVMAAAGPDANTTVLLNAKRKISVTE
jgi:hypothetical protein